MKKLKELADEVINESNLSRIWDHIQNYDCAIITAWRYQLINCVNSNDDKTVLSRSDKETRNKELHAVLVKLGYGSTGVDGSFIEGFGTPDQKELKEDSFFVVNLHNDPKFIENIIKLGEQYCQDSVLLKPKDETAYVFGTNYAKEPGYHKRNELGNFKGGFESMFMSKIRNRPFVFEEQIHFNNMTKGTIAKISLPIIEKLGMKIHFVRL